MRENSGRGVRKHVAERIRRGDYRPVGDEAVMDCPSRDCEGKEPKLYANLKTGLFICFRCDTRGRHKVGAGLPSLSPSAAPTPPPPKIKSADEIGPPLVPARGKLAMFAVDYLHHRRGLALEQIVVEDVRLRPPYVAFPVRDAAGKLVGWQGRRFMGDGPKYYAPEWFKKSRHLYGLDRAAKSDKPIGVVEGTFDVLAGRSKDPRLEWVHPFGSSLSDAQARLLFEHGVERGVVLFFDDDAWEKQKRAWRQLGLVVPTVQGRKLGLDIAVLDGLDVVPSYHDIDTASPDGVRRVVAGALRRLTEIKGSGSLGYAREAR